MAKQSEMNMQEDSFPAAEKILLDIENILKKDSELKSFEIIPVNDEENKSPVYYEENCLGLASWCVKPLYFYTHSHLMELRDNKLRREDPKISSRWLIGALLINPEVSTFWNMRRDLVKNGRLDPIDELRFSKIILYYKAKCFEVFSYRRWLINYIFIHSKYQNTNDNINVDVEYLLNTELITTTMAADRYPNNYTAWNHRQYILDNYQVLLPNNFYILIINEWKLTDKWCSQHVSDHSGLVYRQFLLKKLLLFDKHLVTPEQLIKRRDIVVNYIRNCIVKDNDDDKTFQLCENHCEFVNSLHGVEPEATRNEKSDVNADNYEEIVIRLSYWIEDCNLNESLINLYPNHESLWYHRRFLAYCLTCINASYYKYSTYKTDTFQQLSAQPVQNLLNENHHYHQYYNNSLLKIAFTKRNNELIQRSDPHESDYRSNIIDNFIKFLSVINLGPSVT